MTDDPAAAAGAGAARPQGNIGEFTVSEIAFSVKRTLEDAFGHVRVRGEISGYRGPHSSGHAYFSLKDDKARIEAVVWRATFQRLRFRPEEGMEVIATGRLTTFPGGSKYQIVIEALEPAGIGALMALLEDRRRRLAAEGLFDEGRKRSLPFLPRVVGVVTSPTGAVIRDILHRLSDRFPVHVIVWPVRVQGETAAAEVTAAIDGFNALAPGGPVPRPDLLIVARGGGSLEDLWSFNEENVVRAAARSAIPLIAAIGHETDWTLIDHAADRRAPTPTGAAEMAVPVRAELIEAVGGAGRRLTGAAARLVEARRTALRAAARGLPQPRDLTAPARQRFDLATARLGHALERNRQNLRSRFERTAARLSPAGLRRAVMLRAERLQLASARLGHGLELTRQSLRGRLERTAARLSPAGLHRVLAQHRARLAQDAARTAGGLVRLVILRRAELGRLSRRLDPARLRRAEEERRRRLGDVSARLVRAHAGALQRAEARLAGASKLLESLSHKAVLRRGFAIVRNEADHPVTRVAMAVAGAAVTVEVSDGRFAALVAGSAPPELPPAIPPARQPATRPRRPRSHDGDEDQGNLF